MSAHFRDAVAEYFRARPGQWIDGLELMGIGGAYASRTRISEARRFYGMRIENKVIRLANGSRRSLYCYHPAPPLKAPQRGQMGIE